VSAGDCHHCSARTLWLLLCLQDTLCSLFYHRHSKPVRPWGKRQPRRDTSDKAIPTAEPKTPLPPRRAGRGRSRTTRQHRRSHAWEGQQCCKTQERFFCSLFQCGNSERVSAPSSSPTGLCPVTARCCWWHTRHRWHAQKGVLLSSPLSRPSGRQQGH